MNAQQLSGLLQAVADHETSIEEGLEQLRELSFEDLGYAHIDHHRPLRQGQPEVIFGQGKTPGQIVAIIQALLAKDGRALATRIDPDMAAQVQAELPDAHYDPTARLLRCPAELPEPADMDGAFAAVVSAGTSDLPVAEEAAQTLEYFGVPARRIYDVGVAGIHRLLHHLPLLIRAGVVISVAGMEGALTSVVGGIVDCPVIGVPTSIGYGASFNGLAALLAMLNSCASGVAVVNIDNGFGAAVMATRIIARIERGKCA